MEALFDFVEKKKENANAKIVVLFIFKSSTDIHCYSEYKYALKNVDNILLYLNWTTALYYNQRRIIATLHIIVKKEVTYKISSLLRLMDIT